MSLKNKVLRGYKVKITNIKVKTLLFIFLFEIIVDFIANDFEVDNYLICILKFNLFSSLSKKFLVKIWFYI